MKGGRRTMKGGGRSKRRAKENVRRENDNAMSYCRSDIDLCCRGMRTSSDTGQTGPLIQLRWGGGGKQYIAK